MAAAIDCGNVKGIGEPVIGKRARERHHVAAIDKAAPEATLALGERIEMNACAVLVEPRCDLVFGLLHGDAVHMIDPLSDLVVGKARRAACESKVIAADIDGRT